MNKGRVIARLNSANYRYSLIEVVSRRSGTTFMVEDKINLDNLPEIIRQAPSIRQALVGLEEYFCGIDTAEQIMSLARMI